ncbi:MAG: thioredoxin [Anaerolineae bacterium]|nr:thioredoxin [Anaerolineae bacterium]
MPRFDTPLHTNDHSLDRVLAHGLPVALVLWSGAGLETAVEGALRDVAKTDAGRVLVATLDADDNPTAARRFAGARPTLVTFRDGQPVTQTAGVTADALRPHVDYLLGRGPDPAAAFSGDAARAAAAQVDSEPVPVSDATFRQVVLDSDLPVLVDLWAPWCGPCHMIAPVVDRIAADYAGRLRVAKLNVDENPRTAGNYQVQGIPTMLIFRGGRVVDRIVGAIPEPLLRGKVDAALRSAARG